MDENEIEVQNEDLTELEVPAEEPAEEQVAPVESPPAWDFPSFEAPAPAEADETDYLAEIQSKAETAATQRVTGLLRNQATLRAELIKNGASQEAVTLAEATLLSMDPKMAAQQGAAQIAASLAIGSLSMSGKSWKAAPTATPPPANSVGRENPAVASPEVAAEREAFEKAFGDMGLKWEDLN